MTLLSVLRRWRIEAGWLTVLCIAALWLSASTPVSASKPDRWMYYEPVTNWCYLVLPHDCLWMD